MRYTTWILIIAMAMAMGTVLLPGSASAGVDCWSLGGCGEVKDGMPSQYSTDPTNWKCVKQDFRPSFPALPVCPTSSVGMGEPIPMSTTFGTPAAPEVAQ